MTDKEYYIDFWTPKLGAEEAAKSWEVKKLGNQKSAIVMDDIQPYISQIDGSVIGSRSIHKAHLKSHGCIEIGNETKNIKSKPMTPPPGLKEKLIEVAAAKLRYK